MSLSFNIVNGKINIILLPLTPTINSITNTDTTIIISWNNSSKLLTYNLICSDQTLNMNGITSIFAGTGQNSANSSVATDGGGKILYSISNGILGKSYIFNIIAVASDGIQSLYSSSYYITPLSTPSAPTGTLSGSNINLVLSNIAGATSYNLICSDTTKNVNGITSPYIFSSGIFGQSYSFSIVAVANDGTKSSPSNSSIYYGPIISTNSRPTAYLTGSSINVSWNTVPNANTYNLSYIVASTTVTSITGINSTDKKTGILSSGSGPLGNSITSGNQFIYQIDSSSLTKRTSYIFSIISVLTDGTQSSASYSDPITLLITPSNLTATLSGSSIIVSWSFDSPLDKYTLNYTYGTTTNSINDIVSSVTGNSNPTNGTASIKDLKIYYNFSIGITGATYTFTVNTVATDRTISLPSPSTSITLLSQASITSVSALGTTITLSWSNITGASRYDLKCINDATLNKSITGSYNNNTTVIGIAGTSYTFTITAVLPDETSNTSVVSSSITPLSQASITSVSALGTTITLTWTNITGATYSLNYVITGVSSDIGSISGISDGNVGTTIITNGNALSGSTSNLTVSTSTYTYTIIGIVGNTYTFTMNVLSSNAVSSTSPSISVALLSTPSKPTAIVLGTAVYVKWGIVNGASSYTLKSYIGASATATDKTITSFGTSNNSPSSETASTSTDGLYIYYNFTGTEGNTYTFTVTTIATSTASFPSALSDSVAVLSKPAISSVSAAGTTITINWGSVTNATSYDLTPTPGSKITNVTSPYNFTGTAGNNYTFQVTANATSSTSAISNSSTSIAVLDRPSISSVSASGTSITINWNSIANTTSYTLGYNILSPNPTSSGSISGISYTTSVSYNNGTASSGSALSVGTISYDGTSIYSYVITGTLGTTYNFTITTVASNGTTSLPSATSSSVAVLDKPSKPTTTVVENAIYIKWTIVNGATSYTLNYYIGGSGTATPIVIDLFPSTVGLPYSSTANNDGTYICYNFTGTAGNSYTFTVTAIATLTASFPSVISDSVVVLSQPSINTISALGTSITIKWNSIANASSYTLGYNILSPNPTSSGSISGISYTTSVLYNNGTASSGSALSVGTISYDGTSIYTYIITGTLGTSYNFTISAIASSGTTITSIPKLITLLSQPAIPTVSAAGTTVTISWGSIANATSYDLTPSSGSIITNATSPYNFTGTAGTIYTFQVTAKANSSASAISNSSTSIAVLSTPTNFSASASGTAVTINWSAVTNATSYTLNYNITSTTPNTSGSISGIQSSSSTPATSGTVVSGSITAGQISFASSTYTYTITGTAGTTYNFNVTANATSSTSAATTSSLNVILLTPPSAAPSTSISGTAITVSWPRVPGATSYTLTSYIVATGGSLGAGSNNIFAAPAPNSGSTPASQTASDNGTNIYFNFTGTAGTTYRFEYIAKVLATATNILTDSGTSTRTGNVVLAANSSPATLSTGLLLWLDATDINGNNTNPIAGTAISSWTNKVSLSNPYTYSSDSTIDSPSFQSNISNNLPGVYFDGVKNALYASAGDNYTTNTYFLCFFVYYTTVNQPNPYTQMLGFSSKDLNVTGTENSRLGYNTNQFIIGYITKPNLSRNNGAIYSTQTSFSNNNFHLIVVWTNTTDGSTTFINNQYFIKTDGGSNVNYAENSSTRTDLGYYATLNRTNLSHFTIGSETNSDRGGSYFKGYVCEIAVYNTNNYMYNSTTYRAANDNFSNLEDYFINKWKITRSA